MEKYYYNILDIIYRSTLNYGIDNTGYNLFIDELKRDCSTHTINKIKNIIISSKKATIPSTNKKILLHLRLRDKHVNDLIAKQIKIFEVEKTRSCGKYNFNGGIILYDTIKNEWCNKTNNIENCIIYNISRSCDDNKDIMCYIKYKTINLKGDIVTISKNIWDYGPREDPRIFLIDQKLFISYSYLYFYPDNNIKSVKVKYCLLNNFKPSNEIHLDIGNNSLSLMHKKLFYEKNWLFGQFNDIKYVIYSLYPLKIYDLGKNTEIINSNWMHKSNITFKFNIRGGAPPVILNNKLWIWGHTHEDLPYSEYYPILVVLNSDFSLYAYTDPIIINKTFRIIYPVGAIFLEKENEWVLCCGCDDHKQILMNINHQIIIENLIF